MEQKPALYMWAIVPPATLAADIDALRKEFSENFDCYKALKPPVHLTLYKPFSAPDALVAQHVDKIGRWIGTQHAFTIVLKNFGFFERSKHPVVFIDVAPGIPLKKLNSGLSRQTVQLFDLEKGNGDFNPHVTIGYRDVSPEIFPAVKKAYGRRPFSATFDVDSVCLFRHNGDKWVLQHQFTLGQQVIEQASLF